MKIFHGPVEASGFHYLEDQIIFNLRIVNDINDNFYKNMLDSICKCRELNNCEDFGVYNTHKNSVFFNRLDKDTLLLLIEKKVIEISILKANENIDWISYYLEYPPTRGIVFYNNKDTIHLNYNDRALEKDMISFCK
jgi:hypothetical protein